MNPRTPIPKHRIKQYVFARDNYRCRYCGIRTTTKVRDVPYERTVDHLIPASKGGRFNFVNLVTACRACNERKKSYTLREIGMRLRPVPYHSPEQVKFWQTRIDTYKCANCKLASRSAHGRPDFHGGPRKCLTKPDSYFVAWYHAHLKEEAA